MKKPKNREEQGQGEYSEDINSQNEYQNQNDLSGPSEGGRPSPDQNEYAINDLTQERQNSSRDGGKKGGGYSDSSESDQEDQDQDENDEDDDTDEGTEEDEDDDQDQQGEKFDIKKVGQKVREYIKGESQTLNQENIVKYASIAIVAIYGIRKGGLIGSLLLSAAVGLVTKYLLEDEKVGQEEEQGQAQAA